MVQDENGREDVDNRQKIVYDRQRSFSESAERLLEIGREIIVLATTTQV